MGLKDLIFEVIKSWQVITATGVIIVYLLIVSNVARIYRRPRSPDYVPPKSKKAKNHEGPALDAGGDDDLGLEE